MWDFALHHFHRGTPMQSPDARHSRIYWLVFAAYTAIATAAQETRSNISMGVIRSSFGPAEFTKL